MRPSPGAPSEEWGTTAVAFGVLHEGAIVHAEGPRSWTIAQVAKPRRLRALRPVDELPRRAVGRVLKRDPQYRWRA
jgi:hypothetical protein